MKILLIDDEYRGKYTKSFIEINGFDVDWVEDPNIDLNGIIDKYEVIILDVMMVLDEDSKYLCTYFDNFQWLNTGLHILVYIREKLGIKSDDLKIILCSARNQGRLNEILGKDRMGYYDHFIRKDFGDDDMIRYLNDLKKRDESANN
jgi:CheY-like chemotaxis protein